MNQVIFSPIAEEAYLALLEYYYQYSVDFALALERKLDELMENLKRFKQLCPPSSSFPALRRCTITENITLVYRIEDDIIIYVVSVIDNRSDHGF